MRRALGGLVLLLVLLWGGAAMAIEEPAFTEVLKDGAFEVRDYPALTVAQTVVGGGQTSAAGAGFRRLAGYIFGANASQAKIAMTAPVAQTRTEGGAWVVRFFTPADRPLDRLPRPNDPNVGLARLPAQRMAVLRFSGVATPGAVEKRTAELEGLMRAHRLTGQGGPVLAQYDPPWTPWFMRRNEVMIPVGR